MINQNHLVIFCIQLNYLMVSFLEIILPVTYDVTQFEDEQFLINNKICLIINTAPQEIKVIEHQFITVTNYDFYGKRGQLQHRINIHQIMEIIAKIDSCMRNQCQGIVVVGKVIDGRTLVIGILYFMIKYSWSLGQARAFIISKDDNIVLESHFVKILEKFDKNRDRSKLSDIFHSESNLQEEIILKNTFINSKVENMPNFHGLNFQQFHQRAINVQNQVSKKVKFSALIQEIINCKGHKEVGQPSERKSKFEMIRQKFNARQQNNSLPVKHENQIKQSGYIYIKNKQIIQRLPKKRAVSKTEEIHKPYPEQQQQIKPKTNNYFGQQKYAIHESNPSDIQLSSRKDKHFITHKKRRLSKRSQTQEASNDFFTIAMQKIIKQEASKKKMDNLFKISKSNKTSSKKIDLSLSPNKNTRAKTFKQSKKRIKVYLGDQYQSFDNNLGDNYSKKYGRYQNIVNVNVNLRIQNVNITHDIKRQKQQPSKMINRAFFTKKISKKCHTETEKID